MRYLVVVANVKFEIEEWLTSSLPSNLMAVTLTMKQRFGGRVIDPVTASANMRHFLNVLNQTVFGNAYRRHGKRLTVIPILEMSAWDRLHYHVTMEVPDRFDSETFADLIRSSWSRTDLGYNEIDIQPLYSKGWIEYCLKKFDSSASLDIENVSINR